MKRLAVSVCAVLLAPIHVGCSGGSALPNLETAYEVSEGSWMVQIGTDIRGHEEYVLEAYYEIAGVVRNPSKKVAYATQVIVAVRSPTGDLVHEEVLDIGEVEAGGERSFAYQWPSDEDVELDAHAVSSEPPADND